MRHNETSDPQQTGQLPLGEKAPKAFTEGLPHTLDLYLPTPCKVADWPYQNIGRWKDDVPAVAQSWRDAFKVWRREHLVRLGYNDQQYRREDLKWSQRNFVHALMMAQDRYFYDPVQRKYTVDKYLDDLERRYGGIDSVLIWYVYPNIGIDDRNQTEIACDLPGGVAGLKQAVADFHRRGVKVFLPSMPWDHGTTDSKKDAWNSIVELSKAVNANGIMGDTYSSLPQAFREASDRMNHPLVLAPESGSMVRESLIWNNQSWGKPAPELKETIPPVNKLKWLEPRHMVNLENRWARDRKDGLHYIFFNGVGYVAWENIWGIWNQFTERDGAALKRIAAIYRKFPQLLVSLDWEPYAHTLQNGVFSSGFPGTTCTLWTVVNRNEFDLDGEQLMVAHQDGTIYYDLWHGVALKPKLKGARVILSLALETHGFGAVLAVRHGATVDGLDEFLKTMANHASVPLQSLSEKWAPPLQKLVEIARTKAPGSAPQGMLLIPAAEFSFEVCGVEQEGFTSAGTGFQYPWESVPRRHHRHTLDIAAFYIDRTPVTNAQFKSFVDAAHYHPADDHNFLKDWVDGAPRAGWENKPVTWVCLDDARAYCTWAGKRLPHGWEWQYAAQGTDERRYPWGNSWDPDAVPAANTGRNVLPPADVDAHPLGASPFGVLDLVGNVWQWSDEFVNEHTRAAALRGGSSYQPQASLWYFPQAYRLDRQGKYLLMAPCKDRSACLGFRCVVDA